MTRVALFAVLLSGPIGRAWGAGEPPTDPAAWARAIGQSGLRRFFSTGAELGELVKRQISYQLGHRIAVTTAQSSPSEHS